jgi:hypothetical protein
VILRTRATVPSRFRASLAASEGWVWSLVYLVLVVLNGCEQTLVGRETVIGRDGLEVPGCVDKVIVAALVLNRTGCVLVEIRPRAGDWEGPEARRSRFL